MKSASGDSCPECLTQSMTPAYVDDIGNVEYCKFCGDGWKMGPERGRVTFSVPGRSEFGLWPSVRPVVLSGRQGEAARIEA